MPTHIDDKLISWASDIDDGTIRQAQTTARLPIVAGHVALMPDAHVGLGATVGSVIPTEGAVIPSAVGVDIGCGMIAAELDLTEDQLPDTLDPLLGRIEAAIPAGVGRGHDRADIKAERWLAQHAPATELSAKQASTAVRQFGTLGSGNHFFELCVDERARVLADDGAPIDGLYAAGADAGGIATGGYASGLAQALVLGLVAAESALAD